MKDHVKRMVEEWDELNEKVVKLSNFIHYNPIFKTLGGDSQLLMSKQYGAMVDYAYYLKMRIKLESRE